jgi:8-oxo-dGTP pyrophosphatase MutT (NUDIX family)
MKVLDPSAAAAIAPRAASTTLIVRDTRGRLEVLMVHRSPNASFMPGAYVFPGGAVDAADASNDTLAACDEPASAMTKRIGSPTQVGAQAAAYAVAALRECYEECGLWLGAADAPDEALRARLHGGDPMVSVANAAGLPLHTSALVPWSHWVTPFGLPKRFDTLFFIARHPSSQTPSVDAGETTTLAWVNPIDALAEHAAGTFQMEFATVKTVQSLRPHASVEALFAHARAAGPLPPLHPRLRLGADGRLNGVMLPGEAGYEQGYRATAATGAAGAA